MFSLTFTELHPMFIHTVVYVLSNYYNNIICTFTQTVLLSYNTCILYNDIRSYVCMVVQMVGFPRTSQKINFITCFLLVMFP